MLGGGLSTVAVASGRVRRSDMRALRGVMCAAAPALACGESRATTVAAAWPGRVRPTMPFDPCA